MVEGQDDSQEKTEQVMPKKQEVAHEK